MSAQSLSIAIDAGSSETYDHNTGSLQFETIWCGVSGQGTLDVSGGAITTTWLNLGYNPGSAGTLHTRNSAVVNTTYLETGWYGTGAVVQDGGTTNVALHIQVPYRFRVDAAQPPARYVLNDGTLKTGSIDPSYLYSGTSVGTTDEGVFIQNGGWHEPTHLWLGFPSYGKGTYILNGGVLNVTGFVGMLSGNGSFLQSGGTLVTPIAGIGGDPHLQDIFEVAGGTFDVGTFDVNHYSTFRQTGGFMSVHQGFRNDGTAIFDGTASWSSGTQFVNYGHATFTSDTGSTADRNLSVVVKWENMFSSYPDSIVVFNSSQHLAAMQIDHSLCRIELSPGGDKVLVTSALDVGGKLDLNDNVLIWDYSGASPLEYVRAGLSSARYSTAGPWQGLGITSAMGDELVYGIGYLDAYAPAAWRGEPVDATSILVALVHYGDADLNDTVDLQDLCALAHHWEQGGHWQDGDFNYDGFVDIADLRFMAGNWQGTAQEWFSALAAHNLPEVPFPEPVGLVVLGMATSLLMKRQKKTSRVLPCEESFLATPRA